MFWKYYFTSLETCSFSADTGNQFSEKQVQQSLESSCTLTSPGIKQQKWDLSLHTNKTKTKTTCEFKTLKTAGQACSSEHATGRVEISDKCTPLAKDYKHQRWQSGTYLILTVTQLPERTADNTPDVFVLESSWWHPTRQAGVSKCF